MERLTAEDRMMLWPDQIWPQDIGALALLDGTNLFEPDGRFRLGAVREAVAARLHLVPRFRQLLHVPPRRLGGPLWVDAPTFELSRHVMVRAVSAPGDETRLLRTVEEIRRRRLDRSRPLWEMWFLTGLPQRQVGLFVRMHHTIADGMAGVATIATFLDPGPETGPETGSGQLSGVARPWTPAPMPTEAELRQDQRQRHRERLRRSLSTLAHPVAAGRRAWAAWPALRELLADKPLPATSLHRLVGPGRTLALVRGDLDPVRRVAHRNRATVNDVLLAAAAGGVRALFRSRGEPVDRMVVRIYVPVSLHQGGQAARGNLISQMVVPLPIGESDPVRRLRLIAGETARRKTVRRPSLGALPTRGLAGLVFLRLVRRQRVNLTSADIPGPQLPQYFAGARVREVFPMVQLLGTVSLAVGAMSYAGQFSMMLVADQEGYPDLEVFAQGIRDELRLLSTASVHSGVAR